MNQEPGSPATDPKSTYDPSKDGMRLGCGLMAGLVGLLGGSILYLIGTYVYSPLDFNGLFRLMGILLIVFLVAWFKIIYVAPDPAKIGIPGFKKVLGGTLAAAIGSMITCTAVVVLVNGCGDKSALTREVLCEETGHSGRGSRSSYHARIRVPDNPNRIVGLSITKDEYNAAVPGKSVLRLTTGRGNLHMEWIRKKELVQSP